MYPAHLSELVFYKLTPPPFYTHARLKPMKRMVVKAEAGEASHGGGGGGGTAVTALKSLAAFVWMRWFHNRVL